MWPATPTRSRRFSRCSQRDRRRPSSLARRVPYVAVITGASAGIGEAAARRLAREPDMELVLVARREEKLQALAEELGPERTTIAAVDLTRKDAPARILRKVERERGRLDLLVNNAGAAWRGTFAE